MPGIPPGSELVDGTMRVGGATPRLTATVRVPTERLDVVLDQLEPESFRVTPIPDEDGDTRLSITDSSWLPAGALPIASGWQAKRQGVNEPLPNVAPLGSTDFIGYVVIDTAPGPFATVYVAHYDTW